MTKVKQTKGERIATLERQLREALAGQIHTSHFASRDLEKLSVDKLSGSGVVITMSVVGGRLDIDPFMIRDGLSKETIAAIQKDLCRNYNSACEFKPVGYNQKAES